MGETSDSSGGGDVAGSWQCGITEGRDWADACLVQYMVDKQQALLTEGEEHTISHSQKNHVKRPQQPHEELN